jgi:preprotein translocase subunit SecE
MSKDETKKEKKTSEKSKKQPNKVAKWFKDLKSEFKKVVWPSKKKIVNNTTIVLVTMIISSVFVGALDFGLLKLFNLLLGIGD